MPINQEILNQVILHFIYIELEKFNKAESALETGLDKWIYNLKNASTMTQEPRFAGEMRMFFSEKFGWYILYLLDITLTISSLLL